MEKPSSFPALGGLHTSGLPAHVEERPEFGEDLKPGTADLGEGGIGNSLTEDVSLSGQRPKPKPGNVSAAGGGGGDEPWSEGGVGGKPTTLPQPSRPVAGVGGGNKRPEDADLENWPDQDRPLPDHSGSEGTKGDKRPEPWDGPGVGTGLGGGVGPTVPGALGSNEAGISGGGTNEQIGNLESPGGPHLNPEGTSQHPGTDGDKTQSLGSFGGSSVKPTKPSQPTGGTTGSQFGPFSEESSGTSSFGSPKPTGGRPGNSTSSGDPIGSHGGSHGVGGLTENPGGPAEIPGTQGTPTNQGADKQSQDPGNSPGSWQGSSGGSSGRPEGSFENQDSSGTQAVASSQGSGSPSGSLGTLGAESGSAGIFGEHLSGGGGADNEEEDKRPWTGGIIGENGQSLLEGVENSHNSSHNIVNIFSENENVSIFSENNKLEDFTSTLEALAGNSTASNGLKAAILNYMPSLKWLFVFIDN